MTVAVVEGRILEAAPMPLIRLIVFLGVAVLGVPGILHAQMFKCTAPDGTVAFQQRPCSGAAREDRVNVSQPASGTVAHQPSSLEDVKRKLKETDERLAQRVKREDEERAAADRASQARYERCRSYQEAILRQRAFLQSKSAVVRQSAADEITIQQRRIKDDGC